MKKSVLLIALALAVAGCFGGGDGSAPNATTTTPPTPTATPTAGAPSTGNGTAPDRGAPESIVLYFTIDHTLSPVLPAEGFYLDGNGLTNPALLTEGLHIPPWLAPENASSLQITTATIDLTFSSDSPQQTGGPSAGGDVASWVGEAGRYESFHQADGPDQLAPGALAHTTSEHEIPAGGIVLPAGSAFAAFVGIVYTQSPNAPVKIHVGGEHASRVTLTVRALPPAPMAQFAAREETGALDAQMPAAEFPIPANATTAMIEAVVEAVAPFGNVDVDVLLLSPGGDVLSSSSSPGGTEIVRAFASNFAEGGAGDYVLRVQVAPTATGASATFTARITTWGPA